MRFGMNMVMLVSGALGIAIGFFVRHGTMIGDYAPREIRGTVVDRDGAPIEGARVELRDVGYPANGDLASSRPTDRVTLSDAHGEFRLRTKDDCVLVVTKSGFAPADVHQAREFLDPITIPLEPGHALRARVVDAESARPIVGARVVIASYDLVSASRSAITNEDGRIQVDDLPALSSIDYVVIQNGAFAVRDSVDVPTHGSSEIEIEVPTGSVFRGRVIDSSTGQPIAGAAIFDNTIMGNSVIMERIEVTRSATDGTFALGGASFESMWNLLVVRDGFVPSGIEFDLPGNGIVAGLDDPTDATTVEWKQGFHSNTGIDLTSGEWLEPGFVLDVGMVPACVVTGTVRRSNGLPVVGANLVLVQSHDAQSLSALSSMGIRFSPGIRIGSSRPAMVSSDIDGRFRVDGLLPRQSGAILYMTIDGFGCQHELPTIESLRGTVDIEWTIPERMATLFGIVRVGGKPVPNARVAWSSKTWSASGSTSTNSKGEFRFDAATPGEIEVIHFDEDVTIRSVKTAIQAGVPTRIDLDS